MSYFMLAALQQTGDAMGPVGWLITLVIVVIVVAAWWKVFTKAGQPGWAVLIPIFNLYVLLKICGRPGWWLLLMLIPVVNLIIAIIIYVDLAAAFGHGVLFGLGLFFFNPIFILVLGFGSSTYQGGSAAASW